MDIMRVLIGYDASLQDQVVTVLVWAIAVGLIVLNLVCVLPALWHAGQEWVTELLEDDRTPTVNALTSPPPRPFVSDWSALSYAQSTDPVERCGVVDLDQERQRRRLAAAVHSVNARRLDGVVPPGVSA